MKKFSILHIPVFSFFSKELYKDVGLSWKGVNFLYLLLLLVICWVPAMVKMYIGFSDFVNNEAPPIVNQVPEITINNGEASISQPQPYYIKDPQNGGILTIIDTTGKIKSLEDTNSVVLLTKTDITWRKNKFETQMYELSNVKHFVLDSERITNWLHTGKKLLLPIIYPFAILGSYAFRIIQVLIYAAIGLLFALLCKAKLSYAALLRLAVVAITPSILLKTFLGIPGIHLPYAGLIFLAITLGYLFFAVKANSQIIPKQQAPQSPENIGV